MAILSAQTTVVTGTDLTAITPAGGGDTVPIGSRVIVRNGSGASINVTITYPGTSRYGTANTNPVKAVAAGATSILGPFPSDLADPVLQTVTITCSATASVQLFVVAF